MVLPFVSLIHAIVALVAVVPYTLFPIARDLVRIQLGYYAMDPHHTPWSQLIKTGQPFTLNTTYAPPSPVHLQYSPISIWEAPPPPPPPPTRTTATTSPTSLDGTEPAVPPPTESTPALAPEVTTFAPAERTAPRSAKQWCPSLQTVAAMMDLACFTLALVICAMLLWELLPIACAYIVIWVQKIVLYGCYNLSLLVTAIGRPLVPQVVWDVVAYREALRRERRVRV